MSNIDRKIAASSFGTKKAVQARRSVSSGRAQKVAKMSDQFGQRKLPNSGDNR